MCDKHYFKGMIKANTTRVDHRSTYLSHVISSCQCF